MILKDEVDNTNLANKAVNGMFWRTSEMFLTQGTQLIVSIILARLILPQEYGIVAIITVFISLANTLISGGFGSALIQKKVITEQEFNSVFTVMVLVSLVCSAFLYNLSPIVADFFGMDSITLPLRILSGTLLLDAMISMQQSMLSRNLKFKVLFYRGVISTTLSGIFGISLAVMGFGIWALIGQQVAYKLILEIILLITVKWKPKLDFSFGLSKVLFRFGWKMLVSNLITVLYVNIRSLVIGKEYSVEDLGLYNKGSNFPSILVNGVDSAISTTMFPIFSKAQNEISQVKGMVRRSLQVGSYLIFPMMAGLAAIATPLVNLLLTEKWAGCIPYVQISCILYAIQPMTTSNTQAYSAIGRSDIYLKFSSIRNIVGIIILIVTIPFGVKIIAIGGVIEVFVGFLLNTIPNKKLLVYSFGEYLLDFVPATVLSFLIFLITSLIVKFTPTNDAITILISIIVAITLYVGLSYLLKLKSFNYLSHYLMSIYSRATKKSKGRTR